MKNCARLRIFMLKQILHQEGQKALAKNFYHMYTGL